MTVGFNWEKKELSEFVFTNIFGGIGEKPR